MVSRTRVLQALGVTPLRLRGRAVAPRETISPRPSIAEPAESIAQAAPTPQAAPDHRIALLRAQSEIEQPALASLYTKITEAISALGLQCVRQADAENDPRVRVLAFGEVPLPAMIEPARVLRADALAVLDADRTRKRALWDLIRNLARESGKD